MNKTKPDPTVMRLHALIDYHTTHQAAALADKRESVSACMAGISGWLLTAYVAVRMESLGMPAYVYFIAAALCGVFFIFAHDAYRWHKDSTNRATTHRLARNEYLRSLQRYLAGEG